MTRLARIGAVLLLAAAPAAARDHGRAQVVPYIELGQTAAADLNSGDVLTWTSVAAGVDARVDAPRATAQLSYRYERQIAESGGLRDQDSHSGLARAEVRVTPNLTLDAGALATRTHADGGGGAARLFAPGERDTSLVYALYAGPSFAARFGPVALAAAYQIGYTRVDAPRFDGLAPGPPRGGYFDDSLGQSATASAGIAPRAVLPVGLTASAGWFQERAGQLGQHYDDRFGRGDVLAPISANVAIAGGVGYEAVTTSQRDPLLTAAGAPLLDPNGRFRTDPNGQRRITYRTDGLYYDAGVVWRPNRRTSVAGYAGRRYGSGSYTGAISWQASPTVGFAAQVYDSVTTFGRQLRTGIDNLPTSFIATRDQFAQAFNGCTFGTSGAAPGGCLDGVFQSVTAASYRARGVDAVLSATRGPSTYGVGAGYANRKLFAPVQVTGASIYGREDQSWYADLFLHRALSPVSGVDATAFFDDYDPAQPGADDVLSTGATASYYHDFGRLGTTAALGLYAFRTGGGDETALRGQATVGARYSF
ncbi:hypothetical protein [uncultured Sphingomonas sp.]|uniref:hypothetical protein n=1 Tax=uncultured Sphingomonas sp. TaxID=158754 RepID=UPI0035CBC763